MSLGESDYTGSYRESLSGPVRGLWSGALSRDEFQEAFDLAVDVGIRRAWREGLEKAGIDWEDRVEEDEISLADFVLEQLSHVSGFADFIEANSKKSGGKLASLQYRLTLWANAYNKAVGAALLAAKANPLLIWTYGDTVDHCRDCSYAAGRVYRKSVWVKWGWATQDPKLDCRGYNCRCSLDPVAKGAKANKGHPRRLGVG